MKKIILDTDIGPDVDDVGALALLFQLAKMGYCEPIAVTNCTSSRYGTGCIDVIAHAYGFDNLPVGAWPQEGFLDHDRYTRYNRTLCEIFPNRFSSKEKIPDAIKILRQTLANQTDKSVVMCAIGPLNNLSALLNSSADEYSSLSGESLVANKVQRLIIMGGGPSKLEWNYQMCPSAARDVSLRWPSEIWYTIAETGWNIITGMEWYDMIPQHPVRLAYTLYAPEGRMSWDLTAVWAAVMEEKPYFILGQPGYSVCTGMPDGTSIFTPDIKGKHRYLYLDTPAEEVGRAFDKLICTAVLSC